MINIPELEQYLNTLEIELHRLPATKKAEIILEVEKDIHSRLEKGESFKHIVSVLGGPSQLGQKYLRSLGYVKKEKSSWGKWFLLTILGFFLILFVSAGVIVWKFSPVISVDEKTGRFQFLGGLIDIQANPDGSFFAKTPDSIRFSGQSSMEGLGKLNIKMKNGNLDLQTHQKPVIEYDCHADSDLSSNFMSSSDSYVMDFQDHGSACSIRVPENILVQLNLSSGSVGFNNFRADLDAKVRTGVIVFKPASNSEYSYSLSVEQGSIGQFNHSDATDAHKIKIELKRGSIRN